MTIDPGPYASSPEGIDRAEELAAHTMDGLLRMVDVARLDTTVTSMFMLAQLLAGLEVYAGLSPADAAAGVQHLTAELAGALRAEVEAQAQALAPVLSPGPRTAQEASQAVH